jgi:histo-blood group ABO system transferase
MLKVIRIFIILLFLSHISIHCHKVGLLVMATGKYIQFIPPLISSARNFFCPNQNVTYFVFTDQPADHIMAHDVRVIYQKRLGWPFDTMHRFLVYLNNWNSLENMDYLFACDADMRFMDVVGDEILSDRVGTQHPGFVGKRGTYETNSISKACVHNNEGKYYFAGGFYGASQPQFLKLLQTLTRNIDEDMKKNFIAIWHDESHLNRYFIDNPPTKILSPEYCYPESWKIPYKKRLIALDKNHAECRE